MKILQLTVHYSPNVGGVETHLDDLVNALVQKSHEVFVLTYRPLINDAHWEFFQKDKHYTVLRIPWLKGLFYKLVNKPLLEFIYLFPGLFFVTPFIILLFNPDVIHAHGLVAGFIGVFWGKAFGKKVVISTHSIYHFPNEGFYTRFVRSFFSRADKILCLSKQSAKEVQSLGIEKKKTNVFTYWVDLNKFKPVKDAKNKIGWNNKFVVLFVGRLVEEKGVLVLLESANKWNVNIHLAVAGSGPLVEEIKNQTSKTKSLIFLGKVDNNELPVYYSASDIVIVPSIHDEGFGRVILESLACGTPVIGSNRGAIPEAMDESVGQLLDINPINIRKSVEYYYNNRRMLGNLSKSSRKFAQDKYSTKNISVIRNSYSV